MPDARDLDGRLGLNIPYEWWPSSPMLKEIEASGFGWVQIPAPPSSLLTDPRAAIRHARSVAGTLATTRLRPVLHAPTDLMLGEEPSDRAFEGALSYAAECGAGQVVLHARSIAEERHCEDRLRAETRSLARAALRAERLGLTIAIENLAPVYPGPETVSAVPSTLRHLARQIGSDAIQLCLDVGHANVIAGLRRTSLAALVDPVLDMASVFHVHDNFGARRDPADQRPELDPIRLDLHLAPGRGSLAWDEIATALVGHRAPLLLEIHPPHRPPPTALADSLREALLGVRPQLAH